MSDLERALERWDNSEIAQYVEGTLPIIVDAARRFALLTSPETIEKGAKAINAVFSDAMNRPTDWDSLPDREKEQFKDEAEAVLRAVEEGEK